MGLNSCVDPRNSIVSGTPELAPIRKQADGVIVAVFIATIRMNRTFEISRRIADFLAPKRSWKHQAHQRTRLSSRRSKDAAQIFRTGICHGDAQHLPGQSMQAKRRRNVEQDSKEAFYCTEKRAVDHHRALAATSAIYSSPNRSRG